jgi:hypothetical protein
VHVGTREIELAAGRTANRQTGKAFALVPGAHQEALRRRQAVAKDQGKRILGVDRKRGIDALQLPRNMRHTLTNGGALPQLEIDGHQFATLDNLVGKPQETTFPIMRIGSAISRRPAAAQRTIGRKRGKNGAPGSGRGDSARQAIGHALKSRMRGNKADEKSAPGIGQAECLPVGGKPVRVEAAGQGQRG